MQTIPQRNAAGSASITLTTTSAVSSASDLLIYFGSNRGASTDTVNRGALQQQANNLSSASGCLYTETGASGLVSPTFLYSVAGSGNYQAIVDVQLRIPAASVLTVPIINAGAGVEHQAVKPPALATGGTSASGVGNSGYISMGGAGGTGAVSSVFGRTGNVIATTGDYSEGQIAKPIRTTAVNTTVTSADYTVVATAPSITITLPSSPAAGDLYHIKNGNSTAGQLITLSAAVNIDIATSLSIGATASATVQFDGAVWRIL